MQVGVIVLQLIGMSRQLIPGPTLEDITPRQRLNGILGSMRMMVLNLRMN